MAESFPGFGMESWATMTAMNPAQIWRYATCWHSGREGTPREWTGSFAHLVCIGKSGNVRTIGPGLLNPQLIELTQSGTRHVGTRTHRWCEVSHDRRSLFSPQPVYRPAHTK